MLTEKLSSLREQEIALKNGVLPKELSQLCDSAKEHRFSSVLNRDMVTTFIERVYAFPDHYEIIWKFQDIWEDFITAPNTINTTKEGESDNGKH